MPYNESHQNHTLKDAFQMKPPKSVLGSPARQAKEVKHNSAKEPRSTAKKS